MLVMNIINYVSKFKKLGAELDNKPRTVANK